MDSETEQLVYCELCGYMSADNLCDHVTLEGIEIPQQSESIYETEATETSDLSGETLEELLISLVESRRQLWDSRLPITKRNKVVRDKLWIEIYEALQRQYTIEFLQKKWRNLRDTYIKKKSEDNEYVPSGSAAKKSTKKVWKHYDLLAFLSDIVAPRRTSSNLESDKHTGDKENVHTPSTSSSTPIRTKRNFNFNSSRVEDTFIQAIQNIKPLDIAKNPEYRVNPICMKISQILDGLDNVKRARLEIDLLTKTYNVAYPNMNEN